jgi:hypothetical protein
VHEPREARRLSAETLIASRRSRGEEHPYTLLCAVNAAFDLLAVGETDSGRAELAKLAVTLVHELQHFKLTIIYDVVRMADRHETPGRECAKCLLLWAEIHQMTS